MQSTPTAADLQMYALVVTIGAAFVSAAVALVATWLAHVFAARREAVKDRTAAENRKRDFLRDKSERLVECVHQWYENELSQNADVGNIGVYAGTGAEPPAMFRQTGLSPEAQAQMLVALYFPGLTGAMTQVRMQAHANNTFRSAEINLIAANLQGWRANSQPTFGARSVQAAAGMRTALLALEEAVRQSIASDLMPV